MKTLAERSPWSPGAIKPVYDGWYEIRVGALETQHRYWENGDWWSHDENHAWCAVDSPDEWRGLANDPDDVFFDDSAVDDPVFTVRKHERSYNT